MSDVWWRCVGKVRYGKFHAYDARKLQSVMVGLEGKSVEIAVRQEQPDRTIPQNALIHVLARAIAEASGHTLLEVKRIATLEALGPDAAIETYNIEGEQFREVKGTSSLLKEEGGKLLDVLIKQAEFLEIPMPNREEIAVVD